MDYGLACQYSICSGEWRRSNSKKDGCISQKKRNTYILSSWAFYANGGNQNEWEFWSSFFRMELGSACFKNEYGPFEMPKARLLPYAKLKVRTSCTLSLFWNGHSAKKHKSNLMSRNSSFSRSLIFTQFHTISRTKTGEIPQFPLSTPQFPQFGRRGMF